MHENNRKFMENVISRIYWLGCWDRVAQQCPNECIELHKNHEERIFRVEEKLLSANQQKKNAIKFHIFFLHTIRPKTHTLWFWVVGGMHSAHQFTIRTCKRRKNWKRININQFISVWHKTNCKRIYKTWKRSRNLLYLHRLYRL